MKNNTLVTRCFCIVITLFRINPSVPANSTDWILIKRFESQQQLARDGKVQAMYEVGRRYARDRGTAVNFSRAAEWYQKASDAGNLAAKAWLGILYYEGQGISKTSNSPIGC